MPSNASSSIPSVLTANLLRTGEVVYLPPGGRWVPRLDDARLALDDDERTAVQETAARYVAAGEIVAPYLMDVRLEGGFPRPASMREVIRASRRPTI